MGYGADHSNIVQDILASFFISLFATTPGFVLRKLFEYSKPKEEQFQQQASLTTPGHPGFGATTPGSPDHIEQKINVKMIAQLRHSFYEWMFPLPSYCRLGDPQPDRRGQRCDHRHE